MESRTVLRRASAESIYLTGETGPVWRVVQGLVRLDRDDGPSRVPVQLALTGDLIGIESLCEQRYRFSATAFTDSRIEAVRITTPEVRDALLQKALLQQQARCQDMCALRTGSVAQRLGHLLNLLGLEWQPGDPVWHGHGDAMRGALPSLRDIALVVDAKTETVCRTLAQMLPPRSRKGGPLSSGRAAGPRPAPRPAPAALPVALPFGATRWGASARAPLGAVGATV